jgi:hypothetical protein
MRKIALAIMAMCAVGLASPAFATDQDETFRVMEHNSYTTPPATGGEVVTGSIGRAQPHQDWKANACAWRYPSFNPRTGTFVGQDGLTHVCQ